MRRLTTQLTIALLTFLIGIVLGSFGSIHHFRQSIKVPPPALTVRASKLMSDIPAGWQKINVDNKFSFYLPPYMKETPLPDANAPWAGRAFRTDPKSKSKFLYFNYSYGERVTCDKAANLKDQKNTRNSETVIAGNSAKLYVWQTEMSEYLTDASLQPVATLCFPDIGDGKTKLEFYASSERRLDDEIMQIFNSIEFQ